MSNDPRRALLRHFLAALAYRTQKALRGAPPQFADYDPGARVRRPRELLRHMTSVLGYARTFFLGGTYRAEPERKSEHTPERWSCGAAALADDGRASCCAT